MPLDVELVWLMAILNVLATKNPNPITQANSMADIACVLIFSTTINKAVVIIVGKIVKAGP